LCCRTAVRPHTTLASRPNCSAFAVHLSGGRAGVCRVELLAYRLAGMTTMLIFSILCTLAFTLRMGCVARINTWLNWRELAGWFEPCCALGLVVPAGLLIWWLTRMNRPLCNSRCVAAFSASGQPGVSAPWPAGLLQLEIHRAPGLEQAVFARLGFVRTQS